MEYNVDTDLPLPFCILAPFCILYDLVHEPLQPTIKGSPDHRSIDSIESMADTYPSNSSSESEDDYILDYYQTTHHHFPLTSD